MLRATGDVKGIGMGRYVLAGIALFAALTILAGCGVDMDAPVFSGPASQATQTPTRTATPNSEDTPTETTLIVPDLPTSTAVPSPSASASLPSTTTVVDPTRFSVDLSLSLTRTRAISPYIYGVADPGIGNEDTLHWLGATLARWGGNARSMHNWETNTSNVGSDGDFKNVSQGDNTAGSASLGFLQRNARLNAASILTIPMIGWVAKDSSSQSKDVPKHGGPPVSKGSDTAFTSFENDAWATPYDPAPNRSLVGVQSLPSKGAPFAYPPDLKDGKVYQDEWVAFLKEARTNTDAPTLYAMDNEPDLWADSTHVDVHPTRMGYDDMLSSFLTYARAVKKVDPNGLVAGPESWGVTGYLYSALDEGGDSFATAADRMAHGDVPFIEWFLRSVAAGDKEAGSRSLDVLSLHYYPSDGQYLGGNDPDMQDKRMQAPRALWDGLYTESGWVGRTEWGNLALIRRMQLLIDANYPGTKFCLTEWNFGGEDDISGAIATADTLGILGREGAYCAAYWGLPKEDTAAGWAFRLFHNYDGKGAAFGTKSVAVEGDSPNFSSYASLDDSGSTLTMVLINKERSRSAQVSLDVSAFSTAPGITQYTYTAKDLRSGPQLASPEAPQQGKAVIDVAPMSISIVAFDKP